MQDAYAPSDVWDSHFQRLLRQGRDLNPSGWWASDRLPLLTRSQPTRLLDLGCGTGGDCLCLAKLGWEVSGMDYSPIALEQARAKATEGGLAVDFRVGDMAETFPFPDQVFDAVMSNVAFHSFPDRLLRSIMGEIKRILKPAGLLLLHVNSTEDLLYRPKKRVRELEPHFYLEEDGQTVHFFSEGYCRELLADFLIVELTHLRLHDQIWTQPKCVWRCMAQKPGSVP